jgi:predicted DCC family thiol-disulfide oxidoreductase YuxK
MVSESWKIAARATGGENMTDTPKHETIVLFDGVCNLCNRAVRFIIPRDPRGRIRFASRQSPVGQRLLAKYHAAEREIDSVVLIDGGQLYTKSSAVLRITHKLNGLWPTFYLLTLLPCTWRDTVYDWVARNRYRWFGKRESCMLPTPDLKSRFLDSED